MALNLALLVVTVAKLTTASCMRGVPAARPAVQAALPPMPHLAGLSRATAALLLLLLPPLCALPRSAARVRHGHRQASWLPLSLLI
jgi:hypothetical protein